MARITTIEGIGPAFAEKFREIGITTVEGLLEKGKTARGRRELVETTGISSSQILRWVNCADLMRIKGIGEEYSELLEAAGVDTVPELALRNPANLYQKMVEANEVRKLVRLLPALKSVEKWVAQAKELPRVIEY